MWKLNTGKTWQLAAVGGVALALAALPAVAQQAPTGTVVAASAPGKVGMTEAIEAAARVAGIDKATRKVTLKAADGRSFDIVAGDEVRNFDQIKVGDNVIAKYVRGVTLELRKGGGALQRAEGADTVRAVPGEKPAGIIGRRVAITAEVVAIDVANQSISLKGPKGNIVELAVKNPDQFKLVKIGDRVDADYTEALAIAVVPAAGKQAQRP